MYDKSIEEKWMRKWEKEKAYSFNETDKTKPVYVIDTPPPYTNGVLHMGHVSDYSFIDFIARYKRMKGFNVLYPQGWDTMGFHTEITVEKKYGKNLDEKEFLEKCEALTTDNLVKMREQMKLLGFSVDFSREYITMSREYKAKVQLSLLLMYEKGLLYIGDHAVYWCPYCKTAIAREQIEDKEEKTKLNYVRFDMEGGSAEQLTIATTRPELLHACVAVAVNPTDERYAKYIGKQVSIPLFGRKVKIIGDEDVDVSFGTGAEMVCTFGDKKDLVIYHRHKLDEIKAIDEGGHLLNAGKYTGLSIQDARSAIISDLEKEGRITKKEEILHTIKIHEDCKQPIELLHSTEWFSKTTDFVNEIKEQANKIKWIPEITKRYLMDWANYIDWDWVISRDRRFDTPLPFWICKSCGYIVGADKKSLPVNPRVDAPPVDKCPKCGGELAGEKRTCDVWIDSSITPLVIAGWPDNKELFSRAFPSDIRINATEIIRSWDFYTIYRVWALTGNIPWKNIFVHGLILGPDGRKMSKSIGNVVSPEELIKTYSADSVRMWAALSGTMQGDKALIFNDVKFAHSFINKLFNSLEFARPALSGYVPSSSDMANMDIFDKYMLSGLNSLIKQVSSAYEDLRFYDAANAIINFYWHVFCDYYLENIKYVVYGDDKARKKGVQYTLHAVVDAVLRMLAPIIPFSTAELYQSFAGKDVHAQQFPVADEHAIDKDIEEKGEYLNNIISMIRKEKTKNKLALNFELTKIIINVPEKYYTLLAENKHKLELIAKVKEIEVKVGKEEGVSIAQ